MARRVIAADRVPATMLERDPGAFAHRLEAHLDLGDLTGREVAQAPLEDQALAWLPREHLADHVAAFRVVLDQPPFLPVAHEAQLALLGAAYAKANAAPPPQIDLVGEHLERVGRRDRDERRDARGLGRAHDALRLRFT